MLSISNIKAWNNMKIGLVLSGGGAKGAYEAGVIRALHELDAYDKVKVVSGTSVGALNTAVFAMGDPSLAEKLWSDIGFSDVLAHNEKKDHESRSIGSIMEDISRSIQKEDKGFFAKLVPDDGLFAQAGLEKILRDTVDCSAIQKSGCEYYVCAYNTKAGRPDYFKLNDLGSETIIKATLASAAIPYVFDPVTIDGVSYADGGINDPSYPEKNADVTPIAPLKGKKLKLIIVVHLRTDNLPDYSAISPVPIIDIIPSRSLEPIRGTGTLNFSKANIQEKMELGYRDTVVAIAPKLIDLLKK